MKEENFNRTIQKFENVHWHDSKLLDFKLIRISSQTENFHDLELNLSLRFKDGDFRNATLVFKKCRILKLDLDLLGLVICGGDIGGVTFFKNSREAEIRYRNLSNDFDFPDSANPMDNALGCLIEMIHPGGYILIFAQSLAQQMHK